MKSQPSSLEPSAVAARPHGSSNRASLPGPSWKPDLPGTPAIVDTVSARTCSQAEGRQNNCSHTSREVQHPQAVVAEIRDVQPASQVHQATRGVESRLVCSAVLVTLL